MPRKSANTETISFKDNEVDNEIFDFFIKKSKVIGKSAYIKQLIKRDMDRANKKNKA